MKLSGWVIRERTDAKKRSRSGKVRQKVGKMEGSGRRFGSVGFPWWSTADGAKNLQRSHDRPHHINPLTLLFNRPEMGPTHTHTHTLPKQVCELSKHTDACMQACSFMPAIAYTIPYISVSSTHTHKQGGSSIWTICCVLWMWSRLMLEGHSCVCAYKFTQSHLGSSWFWKIHTLDSRGAHKHQKSLFSTVTNVLSTVNCPGSLCLSSPADSFCFFFVVLVTDMKFKYTDFHLSSPNVDHMYRYFPQELNGVLFQELP